jgi:hypothetical protein
MICNPDNFNNGH